MAGFGNGSWGKGGASFGKNTWGKGGATFGKAKTSSNMDKKEYSFNLQYGKYNDNNELALRIGFLVEGDIKLLNQIAPDIFYVKGIKRGKAIYPEYFLFIKDGKNNEFINCLDQLKNTLIQTGHYKKESVENAIEGAEEIITETPSNEEIAQNDHQAATNWKDWLKQLQDPEVRKRFLAFQTSFIEETEYRSMVLSPDNISTVLSVDPMATFVTNKGFWEKHFKRRVIPNSPSIVINRCYGFLPDAVLMNDPDIKAAGGWKAILQRSGGSRRNAPAYGWVKRVSNKHPDYFDYHKERVFDVRFTVPMDPNDDPFVKMANLVNNLTGELNDVAKSLAKEIDKDNGVNKDYDKKRQGLETDEQLEGYKEFILKKCKDLKISVFEDGDIQNVIANAVYAYAFKMAEKYNIIADANKELFASAVCLGISNAFNIESNKTKACAQKIFNLSDTKQEEIIYQSYTVFKALNSYKIAEAEGEVSREEYYNMVMDMVNKNQKELKESFVRTCNSLTERMNILPTK